MINNLSETTAKEDKINRDDPFAKKFLRLKLVVATVLFYEKLWRTAWPIFMVLLAFISIVCFDLLPKFPFLIHLILLIFFGFTLAVLIFRLCRKSQKVEFSQVRRRLNKDNNLKHDPLVALDEENVFGLDDQNSALLWEMHKEKIRQRLSNLRVKLPSPGVARYDVFAIRLALILIAIVSCVAGGSDFDVKLARALSPQSSVEFSGEKKISVWFEPPQYMGFPPIFLESYSKLQGLGKSKGNGAKGGGLGVKKPSSNKKEILIPVNSKILAHVFGSTDSNQLILANRSIDMEIVGEDKENKSFKVEANILDSDKGATELIIVSDGDIQKKWPIKVLLDEVPKIQFLIPPRRLKHGKLQFKFEATDDWSIKKVWGEISSINAKTQRKIDSKLKLDIGLANIGGKRLKGEIEKNFANHPWAGVGVDFRLFVRDSKGQIGRSDEISIILPERIFNHPIARTLIEIRKKLNWAEKKDIDDAINVLYKLNRHPEHFFHKTNVFINISFARSRLKYGKRNSRFSEVQDILLKTAILIEDGEFSVAENALQNAWDEVGKAFKSGANNKGLNQVLQKLEQALDNYLKALAKHIMDKDFDGAMSKALNNTIESKSLQKMLNKAKSLVNSGSKDLAYQMISELKRMMRGIREGIRSRRSDPWAKNARKMMDGLRVIAKDQQKLVDKNYTDKSKRNLSKFSEQKNNHKKEINKSSQPQMGSPPISSDETIKKINGYELNNGEILRNALKSQEKVRNDLNKLMGQLRSGLGLVPAKIGDAEFSMGEAIKHFRQGNFNKALSKQLKVLEDLKSGLEQTSENIFRRLKKRLGKANGTRFGLRGSPQVDPFGRPQSGINGGLSDNGMIKVPTDRVIHRSREIFDELHRRSGELNRPKSELDFLRRLLERF